jgi:hypothetical protein
MSFFSNDLITSEKFLPVPVVAPPQPDQLAVGSDRRVVFLHRKAGTILTLIKQILSAITINNQHNLSGRRLKQHFISLEVFSVITNYSPISAVTMTSQVFLWE